MFLSKFIDTNKISKISWLLVFMVTITSFLGFAMMYSAAKGNPDMWAYKQLIRYSLFLPIMLLISLIDIRFWLKYAYLFYFFSLILLILVELKGHIAMGAQRWINIGGMKLQPSEMMKITLVMALARYFQTTNVNDVNKFTNHIAPILMILLPSMLVLKQPDLGTAGILIFIGSGMLFLAGIRIIKFAIVGILGLCSIPIAWQFLHDYQQKRILTFLDPDQDPLGAGYNILQSKIAIGSGGILGKGFMLGSQSQLSFLPEKHTDFIFSMLVEEIGFIGGTAIILIYLAISIYGTIISLNCQNHFGRLLGMGIVLTFFIHFFINISMVMGLIPIVGVPLPLLSYGGTIMITIMTGFGLLLNVSVHYDKKLDRALD